MSVNTKRDCESEFDNEIEKQNARRMIGKIRGRWTPSEKMAYFAFLQSFPQLFDRSLTKSLRTFKKMAKVICTRTATQCRSHHQKMLSNVYIQNIADMGAWINRMMANQVKERAEEIKQEPE